MEICYGFDFVVIFIENFYKEMDCFEVCEFIVVGVYVDIEEEIGVLLVDDFVVLELEYIVMCIGKEGRVGIVNVRVVRSGLISGDMEGE